MMNGQRLIHNKELQNKYTPKNIFVFYKNDMSSFSKEDAAMFAPLGVITVENHNDQSAVQQTQLKANPVKPPTNETRDQRKQTEEQRIASLRIEEDLIDLSTLSSSSTLK